MLVIGNTGIISPDYEALAELLQVIKAALS